MSRYHGPKCRICRKLGMSVCGSQRCALERKPEPPGVKKRYRSKASDFKIHLMEKQRLRYSYWIGESQFRRYVHMAHKQKGVTGHNLITLLERRLDNLVYRMGFAPTLPAARQLVTHRHILVNGSRVDRPSYLVNEGDVVSVKEQSRGMETVHAGLRRSTTREALPYIEVHADTFTGSLVGMPSRDQVPVPVREDLVVEYYSKYM